MRLNVAYTSSEKYAKYAYISLLSLFETNKDIEEIYIYYIEENLSKATKELIVQLVESYKRKIEFFLLFDLCSPIININILPSYRGSMGIYSSLFLTKLGINRVLAIDCDVIINGSLKKLININLNDNYLAGLYIPFPKKSKLYKDKQIYINGGIILQDLDKLRKDNSEQKFIDFLKNTRDIEGSEPIISVIYKEKIFPLPPKYHVIPEMYFFNRKQREELLGYNYYSEKSIQDAINNPVLLHYANSLYGRPWNKKCDHPRKELFLKYLNMSPWAGNLEDGDISIRNKITKFAFKHLPFPLINMIKRK